jgi:hypothetical protein
MSINRRDFAIASGKAVDKDLRAGEWLVYQRYEDNGRGESAYLQAPLWWAEEPNDPKELDVYKGYKRYLDNQYENDPELAAHIAAQALGIEQQNEPERYVPLNYHDLFLQFAGLVEEGPITLGVVLGWAELYGVLGLEKTSVNGMGNPRGGPAESVSNFASYAEEAHMVLRFYGAVTDPEGPDYEYLRKHIRPPEISLLQPFFTKTELRYEKDSTGKEVERAYQRTLSQRARETITQVLMDDVPPEKLKKLALDYVEETVHLRVTQECHPRRYRQKDGTSKWGWGFKSLLGAMWMQMMWLMDAREEDVRRCPWCRKVITFEPSPEQPEANLEPKENVRKQYKVRVDKIFCDDPRCKANWNYHFGEGKSSKHARKRERERRKADDS